jgi:glycosyltransferase involved in cell wall biosynthesis
LKSAVLITVYKRYDFIKQAINSILSQTVLPEQIIIAADNSDYFKDIKNMENVDIVEANYKSWGMMVGEAIKNLKSDIDIVFFLDDDDLFEKNKIEYIKRIFEKKNDLVAAHNLQKFIDINGNEVNNKITEIYKKNQPNREVIISKNNVFKLWNSYPHIMDNFSSITVKKYILDKHLNQIIKFDLMLDTVLIMFSLIEGNVVHIPEKLTWYRLGSGQSSYDSIKTFEDFLKNKRKIICIANVFLEQYRKLNSIINDSYECKKLIERNITYYEMYLYIQNNYFDCNYKANIPSWSKLISNLVKSFLKSEFSLSSTIKWTGTLFMSKISKDKTFKIINKREFNQLT